MARCCPIGDSPNDGLVDPKLKPGKEIYQADGTIWQGLSHASTLKRVGSMEAPPPFEQAHNDHWRNFLLACRGEEKAKSPLRIAAPLSQLFCLGVIAQRLNRGFAFDPDRKVVVGDEEANLLLQGPSPRAGWEEYYAKR